jgi:probable phosphoglycerate mutase
MTTTFILIRHGETEWNREGRIQGHMDSPLTPTGIEQAQACALRLKVEPIDHVIASDLARVKHTTEILATALDAMIEFEPALRERSYGIGEGMTFAELDAIHPEMYSSLRTTDPDFTVEGGESRRQFHDRVTRAMRAIADAHPGKRVLVVTHGGVLGVIYRWIMKLPIATAYKVDIPNVAYNRVVHCSGTWTLEAWADTDHLDVRTFEVG